MRNDVRLRLDVLVDVASRHTRRPDVYAVIETLNTMVETVSLFCNDPESGIELINLPEDMGLGSEDGSVREAQRVTEALNMYVPWEYLDTRNW